MSRWTLSSASMATSRHTENRPSETREVSSTDPLNGVENEIASLTAMLRSIGVTFTSNGEIQAGEIDQSQTIDESGVEEMLQIIERANSFADGVEGRLDTLLEHLESLLTGLIQSDTSHGGDKNSSALPEKVEGDAPVEVPNQTSDAEPPTG